MDLVYILGNGSECDDEELRYSLRSAEKYLKDLGTVYIVGEKPAWLKNVVHIHSLDSFPVPWANKYIKIKQFCMNKKCPEEFLQMDDDYYFIEPIEGKDIPYYVLNYDRTDQDGPKNAYFHYPVRFNKGEFISMLFPADGSSQRCFKSAYINQFKKETKTVPDCLYPHFQNGLMSSDNDIANDPEFWAFMKQHFPEMSKFEIPSFKPLF